MANLMYGILRSRSPLWRSIMHAMAMQPLPQHPPFLPPPPSIFPPLRYLNPSLSISTSSFSTVSIMRFLQLTGLSLFPPVRSRTNDKSPLYKMSQNYGFFNLFVVDMCLKIKNDEVAWFRNYELVEV